MANQRVEVGNAGTAPKRGALSALCVEAVTAEGEVTMRFAGGQRLRVHISPELVPYYRRMISSRGLGSAA